MLPGTRRTELSEPLPSRQIRTKIFNPVWDGVINYRRLFALEVGSKVLEMYRRMPMVLPAQWQRMRDPETTTRRY